MAFIMECCVENYDSMWNVVVFYASIFVQLLIHAIFDRGYYPFDAIAEEKMDSRGLIPVSIYHSLKSFKSFGPQKVRHPLFFSCGKIGFEVTKQRVMNFNGFHADKTSFSIKKKAD